MIVNIWFKIKGCRVVGGKDVLLCLCYDITSGSIKEMFINRSVFWHDYWWYLLYQSQYNDNCNFLLFLLLYADDIVLLSESEIGIQQGLDILEEYFDR